MKTATKALVFAGLALVACGGPGASSARHASKDFGAPLSAAMNTEATGDQGEAIKQYLAIVDDAAQAEGDAMQVPALYGALDALVERTVSSLDQATADSALAYRTSHQADVAAALGKSFEHAEGPFAKGAIARSLEELARRSGDAKAAEKWRAAIGCASEATVTGPLTWTPVLGVSAPDPLAAADAPLEKAYPTGDAFGTQIAPVAVKDHGCWIPLEAASSRLGARDVVVDVDVPASQSIGVAIRVASAATLRVGGKVVVTRPYELGGQDVARFGVAEVNAGRVRMVLRVGQDDTGETVEIDAWGDDGKPLAMHAPTTGERAKSVARSGHAIDIPAPRTDDARVLAAAAALATGDGTSAETWLRDAALAPTASLPTLLLYGRALEAAQDLSLVHKQERMRAVYERVLDAAPASWEAVLAHAVLAGSRKGQGEARLVALGDLDAHAAKASNKPLLDAFDATLAGREHVYDRASAAYDRAKQGLAGARLLEDVERVAFDRAGDKAADKECTLPRDSLACYGARKNAGQDAQATAEIERLRALRGAKANLAGLALRDALGKGDLARATPEWDRLLPGERTLELFAALQKNDASLIANLLKLASSSRDAPASIPALLRAAGDDPAKDLEAKADLAVQKDKDKTATDGAATAVLAHEEHYEIAQDGTTHFVMLDVRRVSGTTDVEENAAASPPDLEGRSTMRYLRRRIYKKDGRVLEPERAPGAAQAHADLAQLEAGDAVMAIYEGWALPSDTGDIGIDTPDLLPDRTAVVSADVDVKLPASLKIALNSHPMLGAPVDSTAAGVRTLHWSLKNHGTRRIEDGVPKMDRDVAVSLSTGDWSHVSLGLRERVASLAEHQPEVAAFAKEAAQGKTGKEAVIAVTDKVGETVREASPSLFSDQSLALAGGSQTHTARTILTDREGSRTWVIVRSLGELGIPADVVVAENEPFSAKADFPPHYGRFVHPLVVAHAEGGDVWIDADVSGPPLPAGRISPELRGRLAIAGDGKISPVPAIGGERERDEIDLRLSLDASGDAKGSLTILLRGREAQEISEALFRVVGVERERALRSIALGWVPQANVDSVALSSSEGSWQIAVRAEISAPGFAQSDGKQWVVPGLDPVHIVFPRPAVSTLGATYASQGGRQEALAISRAVQYHVHRKIDLPKGTSVTRAPGPLDLKMQNLEASRKLTVTPAALEEDLVLGITTGTVSAEGYGAFADAAHKVDDAFLASVRMTAAK